MNRVTSPSDPGPLDHGRTRLRLGAAAGVLGVAAAAGRVLLSTHYDETKIASGMTWASAHPTMVFFVNVCELLGFSLIAFCAITVTGLVRGRGKWLTQIGGWGTAISFLAIAFNASGVFMATLATLPERSTAVAAMKHFEHSGQSSVLLVFLVSSILWPLLLGFGLPRAGLVGWWYAGLVVVWTVLEAVVSGSGLVALVGNIVPLALVVAVWVKLLLDRAQVVAPSEELSPREGRTAPVASRS